MAHKDGSSQCVDLFLIFHKRFAHGHWDLPVDFSELDKSETVKMGVSTVIPAKKILEILYSPALVEARNKAFHRAQSSINNQCRLTADRYALHPYP